MAMMVDGMVQGFGGYGRGPAGGGGAGEDLSDPAQLMAALTGLAAGLPKRDLVFPPGFVKPKRPEIAGIKETADRLWSQHRSWRALVDITQRWVNQQVTGAFNEDIADREAGFQEEYVSSALSDERNLLISKAATLKTRVRKDAMRPELRGYAQQVEDAALWMRECYARQHAAAGNRPLELDEATLFVDFGMFAARQTFVAENPEFPLDRTLVDPTQVYPVWNGRRGLKRVYRIYHATLESIMASYGEMTRGSQKRIEDAFGSDLGSEVELPVYEYWDEWWRCVLVGETPIVGVTDHGYGFTPWTVQYGGMGDPMFTRSQRGVHGEMIDGSWRTVTGGHGDERLTKSVPMLYYRLRSHDLFTAIMARIVTGFKKEIHPPMIRERSNLAAEKAMPDIDFSPGAQNETMLGEERITALPTATAGPTTQALLSNIAVDRQTGSMPLASYGQVDRSNVSGMAINNLNDAGNDKLVPLVKPMEYALARELEQGLMLIRNFGDLAKYAGPRAKPLYVPVRSRGGSGYGGFELTPEAIDEAGACVSITFTKVDPRDWMQLFNAGRVGVDAGFVLAAEVRAEATGEHDYERFLEEWTNEQAFKQALQLPEFAKAFTVPAAIIAKIQEAEGNPEMQGIFRMMLEQWKQATAPQAGPGGGPGGPGGPGAAPSPSPSPVPGEGGTTPGAGVPGAPIPGVQLGLPSTAGMNLADFGMGPGSRGAAVGRPPMAAMPRQMGR